MLLSYSQWVEAKNYEEWLVQEGIGIVPSRLPFRMQRTLLLGLLQKGSLNANNISDNDNWQISELFRMLMGYNPPKEAGSPYSDGENYFKRLYDLVTQVQPKLTATA